MVARQFRIRNWSKFQHYKNRNPPWIKLHVEILSSEDWVSLDDASKLLAVVSMVIASKNDGVVPDNPDYIQRVGYLHKKPNLKPLIECGFLEDASGCKQMLADARPEKETEAETEERKSRVESNATVVAQQDLPDWVPIEAWQGFVEMRKSIRAPLGPRAKTLALNSLAKMRDEGADPTAILDQSTQNSWRGLFPLKNGADHGRRKTAHDNFIEGAYLAGTEYDERNRG